MSQTEAIDEKQRRIARLARRAGILPAMPVVVTRALRCIDDPGSSVGQLAAILNTDQVMTGRVLGLANSAVYSGTRRFVTMREAVVRLGFRTVRDLLFATVVSGLAKSPSRLYGLGPNKLWLHSVGTAIAAKMISETAGISDPERGYIAGLLHDVGMVVLDRALTKAEIADVRAVVAEKGSRYFEAEGEALGLNHAEVGAYQLAQWGMAPELVEAVAEHHHPRSTPLSAVVHAADAVATRALGLDSSDPGWRHTLDLAALQALLGPVGDALSNPEGLDEITRSVLAILDEGTGLTQQP